MVAQSVRTLGLLAALLAPLQPCLAQDPDYVLETRYETREETLGEYSSTSSSSGGSALAERVVASGPEGIEIEYSIPGDLDEVRGSAMWMYPARVLVAPDGSKRLLNAEELDQRVEVWLAEAGWTREACGRWIFTWNAFQIACDPQTVIDQIESLGMRPGVVANGAEIIVASSGVSLVLEDQGMREGRRVLAGSGPVNGDMLRDARIETELVVAELTGEALTLEEARARFAAMAASGTVSVELEIDADGMIWVRTEGFEVTVTGLEDGDERRSGTTVTTRRRFDQRSHD